MNPDQTPTEKDATAATRREVSTGKRFAGGTPLFYLASAVAMSLSVNTSWRFFDQKLGIPMKYGERPIMFSILELTLLACGVAMRANVRRPHGKPGAARLLAWALCGFSGYMAIDLVGVRDGIPRVVLGPVLALVTFHAALGIDLRTTHNEAAGTWGRVLAEVRERLLSRLGLANDDRDAATRTRDRAADTAARLAAARWAIRRDARLAKAVRKSHAAIDPAQRDRVLAQVAAFKHLDALKNTDLPSPWTLSPVAPDVASVVVPSLAPGAVSASAAATTTRNTTDESPRVLTGESAHAMTEDPARDAAPVMTSLRPPVKTSTTRKRVNGSRQTAAKRIAAVRRQCPDASQDEVAKKARVAVRTAARHWTATAPEPARSNGHHDTATLTLAEPANDNNDPGSDN